MTPLSPTEKRKHVRLEKKFVLRVAAQGEEETVSTQWSLVTSKNISAGGVLFTYNRALEDGALLHFKIHFPKKMIECSGVVRRTNPTGLAPLVSVAARLNDLSSPDREFIERYSV